MGTRGMGVEKGWGRREGGGGVTKVGNEGTYSKVTYVGTYKVSVLNMAYRRAEAKHLKAEVSQAVSTSQMKVHVQESRPLIS